MNRKVKIGTIAIGNSGIGNNKVTPSPQQIIKKLLIGITILIFVMPFSALAYGERIGVEWVYDYSALGLPNLDNAQKNAEGFYNTMGNYGESKIFDWGNGNAWESDFEGNLPYINTASFVFFEGHGNAVDFAFGVPHADNGLSPYRVFDSEASWGSVYNYPSLKWIALSSCEVLQFNNGQVYNRWGWPVFKGLHQILGYDTNVYDNFPVGATFAWYIESPPPWSNTDSWFHANIDKQPSDVWSAVLANPNDWDDNINRMVGPSQIPDRLTYLRVQS